MKKWIIALAVAGTVMCPVTSHAQSQYLKEIQETIQEYPIEDVEIKVDTGTKKVTVNGEKTALDEALDITRTESARMLSNEKSLNRGMEAEGFEAEDRNGNEITFRSPYEAKRLIIVGDNQPEDDHGAAKVIRKNSRFAVFQYGTISETADAYGQLLEEGYRVYIDEILTEDSLMSVPGSTGHTDSGVELMGLDKMQENKYYQQNSVTVAVIDSGVDSSIPGFGRVTKYEDFTDDGDTEVSSNHGSYVAGIIEDSTPDNVNIWSLKAMKKSGRGSTVFIDAAMTYAYEQGADIISMSLGFESAEKKFNLITVLNETMDTAIAHNIPVIVAAGNLALSTDHSYPACYEPVWTVSSINKDKTFSADFSNYGNIDFCAAGGSLITMINGNTDYGTSFSTPYVSSFAAVLKGGDSYPSVDALYEEIKGMCEDLGDTGYDQYYGWGFPHYIQTHDCSTEGHSWKTKGQETATCTAPGKITYICRYCGETKTEINGNALGHNYVLAETKESTCSKKGSKTYRCTRCNESYSEETAIAPNNHVNLTENIKVQPACETAGYKEIYCNDCRQVIKSENIPKLGHSYTVTEKKDATKTATGYIKRQCTVCGAASVTILPVITGSSDTGSIQEPSSGGTETSGGSTESGSTKTEEVTAPDGVTKIVMPVIKIKKLQNKKSRKLVIKTDSKGYSYQIQISTSKKFKNAKKYSTSKAGYTIKKLKKKKKYYVRIRTFATINGKKCYGKWSAKKTVTIKR